MTLIPLVLVGTASLAVLALGIFLVLVVSLWRTPHVPLSEIQGKREGVMARRVMYGFIGKSKELDHK
jgi:hypothetical protein